MNAGRFIIAMLAAASIALTMGAVFRPVVVEAPQAVSVREAVSVMPTSNLFPYIDEAFKSEPEPIEINARDAEMIAQTVWGEARGCGTTEQSAVVWCILNRVGVPGFADTIRGVITQPYQFAGYSASNPVEPELYDLAADVLTRWEREKRGEEDVGRVLPGNFLWFSGDGVHIYFRDAYIHGDTWGWSMESPYEDVE